MQTVFNEPNGRAVFGDVQSEGGAIRRQKWTNPVAVDADRLKAAQAASNSVITTVSTFLAQPDFPRKITVTPGGTTADVPAGDVTITGTDIRDNVITDTITFAANASTVGATTKAFKTVTSVVFPVQDGSAATYDIGVNDALGLDRCMAEAAVLYATLDGTREGTHPTVTYHATDVSKNTVDPNTALNGALDLCVAYVTPELTTDNSTTS